VASEKERRSSPCLPPSFSSSLVPSVANIVLNLFVDGHVGLAPAAANHFFSQCHLPGISHPFCAIAIGAYLMMAIYAPSRPVLASVFLCSTREVFEA
jgi:hypothetical protein